MELWSLLALKGLSLSSEEAEKTASSSHTQAALSLTPGAGTMKTCSASLKYYMQDITVNNYHLISLKIIMLVFIT